jgi:hypothetical protein
MKKKIVGAVVWAVIVGLAAVLYFGYSESNAQVHKPKIDPKLKKIPKLCTKAEIAQWKDNLPFTPKGEFPFDNNCMKCFKKVGVMNLPDMSVWLANKGGSNAPAFKAKLEWWSGKAPFQKKSITVNVPAISSQDKHLLVVDVPQGQYFQTAKPVKLILDSQNNVDECKENNNTLEYKF